MLGELRAPPEELATVGATVGLCSAVDALVLGQAIDSSEGSEGRCRKETHEQAGEQGAEMGRGGWRGQA